MLGVLKFDTALWYSLPQYHISTIIYDTGNYKLILNTDLHFDVTILYGYSSASSNWPASISIASSASVPLWLVPICSI